MKSEVFTRKSGETLSTPTPLIPPQMPLQGGVGVERCVVAPGQWLLGVEGRSLYVAPFQRPRCKHS